MAKLSRKEQRLRRHARVRKYISGNAERPRLAVFRSNEDRYNAILPKENKLTKSLQITVSEVIEASSLNEEIISIK